MSSPPAPELLGLATELVENVIKQISQKGDLSNVRLTCKTLDKHAVKELFKDVIISPLNKHIHSWNSISQDDIIRQIPRHAIIHTQSDIDHHGMGNSRDREDRDDVKVFEDALAAMSKFPNLDSLEISFTPECIGRDHYYWQEVTEEVEEREEMLKLVFQAIKDRAADENNRTIRKLTTINLQNCPIPDFTSSDLFRDVMGDLEELHIQMTQEYNEHGPDHDYTKVELQTFPAYFCSHWLAPISKNLKALSIYNATDNWGPFPGYFDPSGIPFPKLETLALGYYTLAHDNDFDWVLAIKSLRKLILHNCMINSWIRIRSDNIVEWNVRTHDWTQGPNRDGESSWAECFTYAGKWSQNLDRIAGALPNLVDFRFGYGASWSDTSYSVTDRDSCGADMFPQRYICFDNDILPTHWPEANCEGWLHSWVDDGFPNLHKENLESDQKGLDALLHRLSYNI